MRQQHGQGWNPYGQQRGGATGTKRTTKRPVGVGGTRAGREMYHRSISAAVPAAPKCVVKGAIVLWFQEELDSFLRRHLRFEFTGGNSAAFICRSVIDPSNKCRYGSIGYMELKDDRIEMLPNDGEAVVAEYADPRLFDQIEDFLRRLYNSDK